MDIVKYIYSLARLNFINETFLEGCLENLDFDSLKTLDIIYIMWAYCVCICNNSNNSNGI